MSQNRPNETWGGTWTIQKLNMLEQYLNSYTTALKTQHFHLVYIDAFAGSGFIYPKCKDTDLLSVLKEEQKEFYEGSASIALKIDKKRFDQLIFIEQDHKRCEQLKRLKEGGESHVRVFNAEANASLRKISKEISGNKKWRGVLFLDPYGIEVEWATIEKIAKCKALDTWILFPTHVVSRLLPVSKNPDDIPPPVAQKLTRVFGDYSWKKLYSVNLEQTLFDGVNKVHKRDSGAEGIVELYKRKLGNLFGSRLMKKSKTLVNSRSSPLYEFIFCVGSTSPKAIALAKRFADHVLNASR